MNEKNLNAVQIRNDIVNLEEPFFTTKLLMVYACTHAPHTVYDNKWKKEISMYLDVGVLCMHGLKIFFIQNRPKWLKYIANRECSIRFDLRQSI